MTKDMVSKDPEERWEHILIKIPASVGSLIDESCGGKTKGGRGHRGGRTQFGLIAIYEKLDMIPPESTFSEEDDFQLEHIDLQKLDRKSQTVVTCHRNGMSLEAIADYLIANRVPTSRGGQWNKVRVRNMLKKAAKKTEKPIEKPVVIASPQPQPVTKPAVKKTKR
jgi:hypothetical protein